MAGESALDRIACGLGGKIMLPMIKQHIMQMLQNRKCIQTRFQVFRDPSNTAGTLLLLLIVVWLFRGSGSCWSICWNPLVFTWILLQVNIIRVLPLIQVVVLPLVAQARVMSLAFWFRKVPPQLDFEPILRVTGTEAISLQHFCLFALYSCVQYMALR